MDKLIIIWLAGFLIFSALLIATDDGNPDAIGPEFAFWWPLMLPIFLMAIIISTLTRIWKKIL